MFMASRPPMSIRISEWDKNMKEHSLEDFEGRMFKMRLPKSGARTCVGLTCGYLVLFGKNPRDFLLMNPITRHGFHFPKVHRYLKPEKGVRAILVFSPSKSAWVLVVLSQYTNDIWFSIAGKGEWHYVRYRYRIFDLHEFKGKIYVIDMESSLFELELDPEPKLTLLETKNTLASYFSFVEFVCSGENLFAMKCFSKVDVQIHRLDFGAMEWVSPEEKTKEEYVFFVSSLKHSAAIKPGLWSESGSWLRYKRSNTGYTSENGTFVTADLWYFPHDCLKVDLKRE